MLGLDTDRFSTPSSGFLELTCLDGRLFICAIVFVIRTDQNRGIEYLSMLQEAHTASKLSGTPHSHSSEGQRCSVKTFEDRELVGQDSKGTNPYFNLLLKCQKALSVHRRPEEDLWYTRPGIPSMFAFFTNICGIL